MRMIVRVAVGMVMLMWVFSHRPHIAEALAVTLSPCMRSVGRGEKWCHEAFAGALRAAGSSTTTVSNSLCSLPLMAG